MTTQASAATSTRSAAWWGLALAGFHGVSLLTVALIIAINTGFAAMMNIEDPRPFWHPFVTAQCFGLAIAYFVNAVSPWEKTHPVLRLVLAVAIGTAVGYALTILVKGQLIHEPGYSIPELVSDSHKFGWTLLSGFGNGLFVSLFFLFKFREARTRAAMLQADADRNLLSKQAIESELKLMQAQVEPHFLFNTLASVQFLAETEPPKASRMLGHLLAYLRAALPQLRSDSTTLGQEVELAQAYLSIMQMRMGQRLSFVIDVAPELAQHRFPPMMLMSMVENAVKHGLEPRAEGGTIRLEARRRGERLAVAVVDDGRGLRDKAGNGVGLTNLRERLQALYAAKARFTLEEVSPHGARATIEIPFDGDPL
ncbi:MAG TPA: histidine kinase [Casimicrobiaceae bacterium]|jgi:hypothetical protein|nr:histidine kinase [Casimicrobiaceae bacterium]